MVLFSRGNWPQVNYFLRRLEIVWALGMLVSLFRRMQMPCPVVLTGGGPMTPSASGARPRGHLDAAPHLRTIDSHPNCNGICLGKAWRLLLAWHAASCARDQHSSRSPFRAGSL